MMKGLLSWGVLTRLFLLYSCDSHASTAPHSPHPHSHSATGPHGKGRSTGLGAGAVAVMSVTTESDAYSHIGITFVGHPTPVAADDVTAVAPRERRPRGHCDGHSWFPDPHLPVHTPVLLLQLPCERQCTEALQRNHRPTVVGFWMGAVLGAGSAMALHHDPPLDLQHSRGLCTLCPPTNVVDSGVALVARIQHC